jgi:hypothetical protein
MTLHQNLTAEVLKNLDLNSSLIYNLKVATKKTPKGLDIIHVSARVRPISDKDCTGWPTASTRDHKGGYLGGRIRNGK